MKTNQTDKFLALVCSGRKSDQNFVKIKVDVGLDSYLTQNHT